MLAIVLLCALGCLFFVIAAIRFKKQLAKQEQDMANLRATRRQQARDRELALEEFADLQERWRLDLIKEHFEFHTVPSPQPTADVDNDNGIDNDDDVNKRKLSDMEQTNITLSSSYDDTDDEEHQHQLQLRPSSSNHHHDNTTTDADSNRVPPESAEMPEDSQNKDHHHQQQKQQDHDEESLHSLSSSFSRSPSQPLSCNDANDNNDNKEEAIVNIRQLSCSSPFSNSIGNLASNNNNNGSIIIKNGIVPSWLATICRIQRTAEGEEDCCCICLESYQPGDVVCWAKQQDKELLLALDTTDTENTTTTNKCHHMFHKECALQWFLRKQTNNQCPMCRITLLPTQDYDDIIICPRVVVSR
mmetsp:Transcript_8488/g.20419  ORF Transcript_8488/g.20419 Transcript_8488/m.20419 type:complete len:359 (+) Transcript_8488:403-1479(+)